MIQRIGFILIGGGALAALVYFLKWFFATSIIALGFRIGIAIVIVGLFLLLASAMWERYKAAKRKERGLEEIKY